MVRGTTNPTALIAGWMMNKFECFARFKEVKLWHSRMLRLIADAESYSYPAFRESFWELRRESRRAEFALVVALCQFEQALEEEAADANKE
jgi:hypothetical protein